MRRTASLLLALPLLLPAPGARADAVFQPTGERVPTAPGCDSGRPTGLLATFACICDAPGVCNIGDPCPTETSCDDGLNATCESTMWHAFNDNTCIPSLSSGLDPREDASTEPETFAPTCGLTFTVESRGTARFQNAFGWYNATTDGPPDASDLHVMLDCDAAVGDSVVLDVRSEPDYLGGEVGFFLLSPEDHAAGGSCAGGDCCASLDRYLAGAGHVYYSQSRWNPDERGADSFIHLLVYDSQVTDRKFYFAWEDTFNAANNDFTDLVTSVVGVECSGGGVACDTGRPGACSGGVTRCEAGAVECVATYEGEAERCDGLDNDCDGDVDDDAPCADEKVCHNGQCVPRCSLGGEFECPLVYEQCDLDTGLCVERACEGVTCDAGEVCRGGDCVSECEGVVCPLGQTCQLDRCVDRCDGVTCRAGEACFEGLCIPGCNQCNGVVCTDGAVCDDATGLCSDPTCPATCGAGEVCSGGACVDACAGAVCPRGQTCTLGECVAVGEGEDAGVPPPSDAGLPDSPDAGVGGRRASSGCGCVAVGARRSGDAPLAALVLGLAGWLAGRRRRRAARAQRA